MDKETKFKEYMSNLTPWGQAEILRKNPKALKYIDLEKISGARLARLIYEHPPLAEHVDFGKITRQIDIDMLIQANPDLADKFDKETYSPITKVILGQVNASDIDASSLTWMDVEALIEKRPDSITDLDKELLSNNAKVRIIKEFPHMGDEILLKDPEYSDLVNLLDDQPQLAKHYDLTQFEGYQKLELATATDDISTLSQLGQDDIDHVICREPRLAQALIEHTSTKPSGLIKRNPELIKVLSMDEEDAHTRSELIQERPFLVRSLKTDDLNLEEIFDGRKEVLAFAKNEYQEEVVGDMPGNNYMENFRKRVADGDFDSASRFVKTNQEQAKNMLESIKNHPNGKAFIVAHIAEVHREGLNEWPVPSKVVDEWQKMNRGDRKVKPEALLNRCEVRVNGITVMPHDFIAVKEGDLLVGETLSGRTIQGKALGDFELTAGQEQSIGGPEVHWGDADLESLIEVTDLNLGNSINFLDSVLQKSNDLDREFSNIKTFQIEHIQEIKEEPELSNVIENRLIDLALKLDKDLPDLDKPSKINDGQLHPLEKTAHKHRSMRSR